MEYSAMVTLTKKGFHIPEKLLYPVGIYNNTRCWGDFFENVGRFVESEGKNSNDKQVKQILISPVPYSSWACTVRIQARIIDKPDKLTDILNALSSDKIRANIIAISENTSGYNHGRVSLMLELYDMRKWARKIRGMGIGSGDKDKINKKFKKTSEFSFNIFKRMDEIEKCLENGSLEDVFYDTGSDERSYLWKKEYIEEILNKPEERDFKSAIENRIEDQQVKSVSYEWLRTTAICYLHTQEPHPLRLNYNSESCLLENDVERVIEKFGLTLPTPFMATFNPLSKYIRLFPMNREHNEKRLISLGLSYKCRAGGRKNPKNLKKRGDISNSGTKGLLHEISQSLSKIESKNSTKNFSVNLKHIKSYSRRTTGLKETGRIDIVGVINKRGKPNTDGTLETIKNQLGNMDISGFGESFDYDIEVGYISPYKIFLSCREELKSNESFNSSLEKISEKYGVSFIFSEDHVDSVTPDVLSRLDEADAQLVIFSITDEERIGYVGSPNKNDFRPDLGWLLFEYGVSKGKGIPIEQIRDITVVTIDQWRAWIHISQDASPRYLKVMQGDFLENLDTAVSDLLIKITTSL